MELDVQSLMHLLDRRLGGEGKTAEAVGAQTLTDSFLRRADLTPMVSRLAHPPPFPLFPQAGANGAHSQSPLDVSAGVRACLGSRCHEGGRAFSVQNGKGFGSESRKQALARNFLLIPL